jgi:hypothetical protein
MQAFSAVPAAVDEELGGGAPPFEVAGGFDALEEPPPPPLLPQPESTSANEATAANAADVREARKILIPFDRGPATTPGAVRRHTVSVLDGAAIAGRDDFDVSFQNCCRSTVISADVDIARVALR